MAAATIMALVDWLLASRWNGLRLEELALILATLVCIGIAVSPVPAALAWLSRRVCFDAASKKGAIAIVAGMILTVPGYLCLVHAIAADLPLKWFAAASALVQLFLSAWARSRDRYPVMGLAAAGATTYLVLLVSNSVGLFPRAGSGWFDPVILGCAVLGIVTILFSSALVHGLSACLGDLPTPLRSSLYGILGLGMTLGICFVPPGLYVTGRWGGVLAAFALLAIATSRWMRKVPLGTVFLVGLASTGASVYLSQSLPTTSNLVWNATHATAIMRIVSGKTGLFAGRTRALLAELATRPEASLGAKLAHPPSTPGTIPLPGPAPRSAILVTIDALRFDHTGYSHKAPAQLTPNLDRLANESVQFMRAYSQGPGTGLSVASLLWSRYPPAIRFRRVLGTRERVYSVEDFPPTATLSFATVDPMDEPSPNLPESLARAGIATATVSSGFMGNLRRDSGLVRGFGEVIVPEEIDKRIEDDWTADHAITWLRQHATERFFFWVHLFSPHMEYLTHPDGSGFSDYQSEVHYADQQLGRILRVIDELGRCSDTLVVVCADHGESLGEGGRFAHAPDIHEELVHVPLLVRWPGITGHVVETSVPLINLAPTILKAMGVEPPNTMQGRNLIPHLHHGVAPPDDPAFLFAWTQDMNSDRRHAIKAGLVEGRIMIVLDAASEAMACYDLAADPLEQLNLLGGANQQCLGPAGLLAGWFRAIAPN